MTEESVRNSSSCFEIAMLVNGLRIGMGPSVAYSPNCPESAVG